MKDDLVKEIKQIVDTPRIVKTRPVSTASAVSSPLTALHLVIPSMDALDRAAILLRAATAVAPADAEILASWAVDWLSLYRRNLSAVQFYVSASEADKVEGLAMSSDLHLAG